MEKNKKYDTVDAMIERYLANNNDKEAVCYLKQVATESDEYRIYIQEKLEIWFSSSISNPYEHFDKEKAYSRFVSHIRRNEKHSAQNKTWRKITTVAAAVAIAILLPWMGYKYATTRTNEQLADICVTTPNGSKAEVNLPDGTKVWLNAGSKLKYSQGYGQADRNVTLIGEACFDVAKNKNLPFTVSSKSANLKVLGTKFTFRAYPKEENVTVELMRGHVDIENNKTGKHQDMLPNERITISNESGAMAKKKIDATKSDSWIRGDIFFDEMPLGQIAQALERTYGVRIKVASNISSKHFYGAFNSSRMGIEDVLTTMSETQRMSYRRTGNGEYYIY